MILPQRFNKSKFKTLRGIASNLLFRAFANSNKPYCTCAFKICEFPNMVLSKIEYSNAVNARYTFNPLWVSDSVLM